MNTTTTPEAAAIRSQVITHSLRWLAEATDEDKRTFIDDLADSTPERRITVTSDRFGKRYTVTVTDGARSADGGFYEAHDPEVRHLHRRDGREDLGKVAERLFGRDLPEGYTLRVIRHHS